MGDTVSLPSTEFIEKKVEQREGKWCVIHCTGPDKGKAIKCFDSKEEANKMHAAIMANKDFKVTREDIMKAKDGRPPKDWFDACVAKVRASGSAEDPEAVCAAQWYKKKKDFNAGLQKNKVNPNIRHIYVPLIKKGNGYLAIISDNSIDRDNEFMGRDLLAKWAESGALPALIDHENSMKSWAGAFKNFRLDEQVINGKNRVMLKSDFIPTKTNPNTNWIGSAIEEADEMGVPLAISIGAIPSDFETVVIGGKEFKKWTAAEPCESTIVPFGSNRTAQVTIAKALKDYALFSKKNDGGATMAGEDDPKPEDLKKQVEDLKDKLEKSESKFATLSEEMTELKKQAEAGAPKTPEADPKPAAKPEPVKKTPEVTKKKTPVVVKTPAMNPEEDDYSDLSTKSLIKKAYGIKNKENDK